MRIPGVKMMCAPVEACNAMNGAEVTIDGKPYLVQWNGPPCVPLGGKEYSNMALLPLKKK